MTGYPALLSARAHMETVACRMILANAESGGASGALAAATRASKTTGNESGWLLLRAFTCPGIPRMSAKRLTALRRQMHTGGLFPLRTILSA